MSIARWMAIPAIAVLSGMGHANNHNIQVTLEGDQGTPFVAQWIVVSATGERVIHEVEGEVPYQQHFTGEALEVRLRHTGDQGRLTLEVSHKGNRSRSSTSPGGNISLSVK